MSSKKCYIYSRVSTSMQVDGYSLDAQREKMIKYAEFQEWKIVREYSDEGKSGKNIDGRPSFKQMLTDITAQIDDVDYVLVFKLSRFGRNAADVLNSLQIMQDYGVNLICIEDGIDSSKDSGKLMISVLSAVAEIERENILVQTMEGRKQKAREGKWNGGFAPYGYKLENGELIIADDEAEIIRLIYDKYINTTMGVGKIAAWLNSQGYKKKIRQNNTLDTFSSAFVKGVLDNPIYCGKLAYGRRHNEKKNGTRNEYHIIKQKEYMLSDGVHEAIIPEADWLVAKAKREITGVKYDKTHSLEHEHILSGILCCPMCGSGMYGNVNRKRNKNNGDYYKDYFYYQCKHRKLVDGRKCEYKKQWGEDIINNAVEEIITSMVSTPQFAQSIKERIGESINVDALRSEVDNFRKNLRQLNGTKDRLSDQIDSLVFDDPNYDKKYEDLQERQNKIYTQIADAEKQLAECETRIENVVKRKLTMDNIYQVLLCFKELYSQFSDLEKKEFMQSFVEKVEIYPERQPNSRIIKSIYFNFPVYYGEKEVDMLNWDNEKSAEAVCLLSKLKSSKHIDVELSMDELDLTAAEKKATYQEIKNYVLEHYNLKVSQLNIAQVKRKYGIIERENYNKPKSDDSKQPNCTQEKEDAITEALKHFGMIKQ